MKRKYLHRNGLDKPDHEQNINCLVASRPLRKRKILWLRKEERKIKKRRKEKEVEPRLRDERNCGKCSITGSVPLLSH